MIIFISMLIGGCIGYMVAALMVINGGIDNEDGPKPEYKCKHNPISACAGYCCKFCLGASECKYACEGDPSSCGMSKEMEERK